MRTPVEGVPLVVDVRKVLEHPGTRRPLKLDAPVPGLASGLSQVEGDIHLDLVMEALDGGVLVQGEMSGTYLAQCRRCVKDVRQDFSFTGSEVYRPAADVWEEGYVIKDESIDLEPMVRDTVALRLPESPLCREDCAGLCPRCGADLNEGACGCEAAPEGDLRWAALKDLKLENG